MKTPIKTMTTLFALILATVWTATAQQMVRENAVPEQITSGHKFTEGPVWHPSGFLLFSDIPANTIYKWRPDSGAEKFIQPSGHSNGLALDRENRLLLAQHDGALARVNRNNEIEVLADSYQGKRLNSPNDLVVRSDGSIYFTDPTFGVSKEEQEMKIKGVYRYSREKGLELLVEDFDLPNGIAFSPDEKKLYVNDSKHNHIRVFEVQKDGSLANGQLFATMDSDEPGSADGMKVDSQGNLYSTGPGGLWIFAPSGKLIRQMDTPRITNLAWGGKDRKTLFMTAPDAVYQLKMIHKGHINY